MVSISLPDGSIRRFDQAPTVAEVAASIGPGLAKAALAGKVDGRLVDTAYRIDHDAALAIVVDRDPDGLDIIRHSTAHLLAYAVKELFPDAQVTIGPVIENGFYYDIAYKRPFTPEDLEAIEKRMAELAAQDEPVHREVWPRDEAVAYFKSIGEDYKARDHRRHSRRRGDLAVSRGRFRRPVPRPARAVHRQAQGLQADEGGRRLLARRPPQRDAAAHLRHGLGDARKSRTPTCTCSRRPRSATTASSASELDLFHQQDEAPGPGVLASEGLGDLAAGRAVHAPGLPATTATRRSRAPQILDRSLWEKTGHWDNYRDNMFTTESEKRDYAIKPMNCPGHVQIFKSDLRSLPRPAAALRRVRPVPPQRALGRAARHHAGARLHAGRRPHLLHRRPDPGRVRGLHGAAAEGLPRLRLHRHRLQGGARGPTQRIGCRRALGPGRGGPAGIAAPLGLRVRRSARARAPSTARRSNTTSRTRSADPGSAARCRSTSPCPSAWAREYVAEDNSRRDPGDAAPRHRRFAGAFHRHFDRALRRRNAALAGAGALSPWPAFPRVPHRLCRTNLARPAKTRS